MLFLLEQNDVSRGLARKRVIVSDYPDGRVVISYNGYPLPYRIFDKLKQVDQGSIADNKHLSAALAHIKAKQQEAAPFKRSQSAPRRTSQRNHPFDGAEGRPIAATVTASPARTTRATEPTLLAGRTLPRHGYKPRITKAGEVIRPSAQLPADKPVFADGRLPEVHANFRFFNKYVVQKRGRRPAAKTRWNKPKPPNVVKRLMAQPQLPGGAKKCLPTMKKAA